MDFHLRAHAVAVNDADRSYAERKIGGALKKILGNSASKVDVEVTQRNKRSGKPGHRVAVHVFIPHAKTQVVHADGESVKESIDLAADKVARAVRRERNRRRDKACNSGSYPAVKKGAGDEEALPHFEGSPVP